MKQIVNSKEVRFLSKNEQRNIFGAKNPVISGQTCDPLGQCQANCPDIGPGFESVCEPCFPEEGYVCRIYTV